MKSKIEEKIKKAREATNEMFAALDELNESLSEKLEKWLPKRGEYYRVNIDGVVWLCIAAYTEAERVTDFVSLRYESTYLGYNMGTLIRENFYSCTPSEIALLDSKLAEQGKRFDKEKLELVDIPKHKEPIIGEMAIFWNKNKAGARCLIFTDKEDFKYYDNVGCGWNNAILFESPEQYKDFLKS